MEPFEIVGETAGESYVTVDVDPREPGVVGLAVGRGFRRLTPQQCRQLAEVLEDWADTLDEDEAPCCYGYVTSGGNVHEIDCPRFER